jgi:hypothetical protein
MITKELLDVAYKAFVDERCLIQIVKVEAAITAVYPLILEQAARVCEDKVRFGVYSEVYQMACANCSSAIRNLKDKNDD